MFSPFMEIWTYDEILQEKVILSFCQKGPSGRQKPMLIPLSEHFQSPNEKFRVFIGSVIFMLTKYFVKKMVSFWNKFSDKMVR